MLPTWLAIICILWGLLDVVAFFRAQPGPPEWLFQSLIEKYLENPVSVASEGETELARGMLDTTGSLCFVWGIVRGLAGFYPSFVTLGLSVFTFVQELAIAAVHMQKGQTRLKDAGPIIGLTTVWSVVLLIYTFQYDVPPNSLFS